MIRIRQPSNSHVVQKLVETFMTIFTPVSRLLLDLENSVHGITHVYRIIDGFAATTIIKYMSALIAFHRTCMDIRVDISNLSAVVLADVIVAASLTRRSDGSGPAHSVLIKAIRWGYRTFNIECLAPAFDDIIGSFYRSKIPNDRRESLPFSLYILMQFERRVLQSSTPDGEVIIIGAFLFLLWSGFRWSDMQRTAPSTLQWSGTELRGLAWRTKTSSAGCPFGFISCGFLSHGTFSWTLRFLQTLDQMLASENLDSIDFLIPSFHRDGSIRIPIQAMTYSEGLGFLRHFLQLPWKMQSSTLSCNPSSYTLHGLKSTMLSWASQLSINEEWRRLQGHHRAANSSVRLYSRDDVHLAIKLQKQVLSDIQSNWRPVTPLARGSQQAMQEPSFTLERFKKEAPVVTWQFFRFNDSTPTCIAENDIPSSEMIECVSSSDSSSDSSSESDSESETPRRRKQKRVSKPTEHVSAEEATCGLFRNTWHILREWSDDPIISACGKSYRHSSIQVHPALQLASHQNLCQHPGCVKGWKALMD